VVNSAPPQQPYWPPQMPVRPPPSQPLPPEPPPQPPGGSRPPRVPKTRNDK
jgi:hypothetical protein